MDFPSYSLLNDEGNRETEFLDLQNDFLNFSSPAFVDGFLSYPFGLPLDNTLPCVEMTEEEQQIISEEDEAPASWIGPQFIPISSPQALSPFLFKYNSDGLDHLESFESRMEGVEVPEEKMKKSEPMVEPPQHQKTPPRVITNSFVLRPMTLDSPKKVETKEESEKIGSSSDALSTTILPPQRPITRSVSKNCPPAPPAPTLSHSPVLPRRRKKEPKKKSMKKKTVVLKERNFQKRKLRKEEFKVEKEEAPGYVTDDFLVRIKPCRRINTSFASNGLLPYFICSNPYKYLMEIESPHKYDEQDFDFYLMSYSSEDSKGVRLRSGVNVEVKKVTFLNGRVTQRFQVQFTMTSFLNQSVEFKLFIADEEGNKIMKSSKFKIVARKVKEEDDRFWDRFLTDPTRLSGQKRKRSITRNRSSLLDDYDDEHSCYSSSDDDDTDDEEAYIDDEDYEDYVYTQKRRKKRRRR